MAGIRSLCVYCGSSMGNDPRYRRAAELFGRVLAGNGIRLVYGGGRVGLMGVLAEAVLGAGGSVTGIIPRFLEDRERGYRDVTELVMTDNMHDRKQRMFELSDAFVALPGGLGTLDETFEVITWRQLGLHDKPIVVVDVGGYWQPMQDLVDAVIDRGFAQPRSRDLYAVVPRVEDVLPALALAGGTAPAVRAHPDRL